MRALLPLARQTIGYCTLVGRTLINFPRRVVLRRRYAKLLGLGAKKSRVAAGQVAALLRVKNEDFWIELVLRVICKVIPEVVVVDSGSSDKTLEILDELAREGLNFQFFRHNEPMYRSSLITNLIVDGCVQAEWVYLVDGDEIQFENSNQALADYCRKDSTNAKTRRIECHHLVMHPTDILRCTPPLCQSVHYKPGRAYRRQRVRFSEQGINDALVANLGFPGTNSLRKDSVFLERCLALHCPFNQRSTISTYQGYSGLLPREAGYRARYRTADSEYITLPFFPKEILECRYSQHNYCLPAIRNAGIPLI